MAIAYLGATTHDAGAGDGSDASVTIPSGATIALITLTAWDSGGGGTPLSNVVVDGQSDTLVTSADIGGADENSYYIGWAKSFSTGSSKTVSWTWTADQAISEGGRIYITWWSGVDLTTPISDWDVDRQTNNTAVQTTVTTAADEVVVCHTESYAPNTPELTPDAGTPISVYNDDTYQSEIVDIDYFTRTQATHVIDMTGEEYASMLSVVLAVAAGGASSIIPKARHLQNLMSN